MITREIQHDTEKYSQNTNRTQPADKQYIFAVRLSLRVDFAKRT